MTAVKFAEMRIAEEMEGAHQTLAILSGRTSNGRRCELVATVVVNAVGSVEVGFEVGTDDEYSGFFDRKKSLEDLLFEAKATFYDIMQRDDDYDEHEGDIVVSVVTQ
jgi:hypothetical protein